MSNHAILSVMGIAAVVLISSAVYLLFLADSSKACELPGCIDKDENCSKYRLEKRQSADIYEPYVDGVVDIGIVEGTNVREAADLMRTVDTATYMPIAPYRQAAFVCVEDGFEDEWVARLKTYGWVEWAHRAGVNPIDTLQN
jgi:hypothetical protein